MQEVDLFMSGKGESGDVVFGGDGPEYGLSAELGQWGYPLLHTDAVDLALQTDEQCTPLTIPGKAAGMLH